MHIEMMTIILVSRRLCIRSKNMKAVRVKSFLVSVIGELCVYFTSAEVRDLSLHNRITSAL